MILVRSPYRVIVTHPNNFITSIDFEIEISTRIEVLDTINMRKVVTGLNETVSYIDIGPTVRNYFPQRALTFVGTGNFATSGPSIDAELPVKRVNVTATINDSLGSTLQDYSVFYDAMNGYGKFQEGSNLDYTKRILLSNNQIRVFKDRAFTIPVYVGAGATDPTVNGVAVPLNANTFNTQSYVQYITIDVPSYTGSITFEFEGETVYLEIIKECKYPITEIQFLNRWGAMETLHFFKVKKGMISTEGQTFVNTQFDVNNIANNFFHQKQKVNVQGAGGFEAETGFIFESQNETIEQLLLSEIVFVKEGTQFLPVNVKTGSLDFKTRIKDKLISYGLEFDYAYHKINNV